MKKFELRKFQRVGAAEISARRSCGKFQRVGAAENFRASKAVRTSESREDDTGAADEISAAPTTAAAAAVATPTAPTDGGTIAESTRLARRFLTAATLAVKVGSSR